MQLEITGGERNGWFCVHEEHKTDGSEDKNGFIECLEKSLKLRKTDFQECNFMPSLIRLASNK